MTRVQLNFPSYRFRLKRCGEREMIWSNERRVWLVLTPEEWVRQHVVEHLKVHYGPEVIIAQEYGVDICGQSQRVDIVIFDRAMNPLMLVECKAPEIPLDDAVLAQAVRYNSVVGAPKIYLTNGLEHKVIDMPQ